ncbi:hypothetical protein [Actinacidiphila sp. ITFR-21]|uniref:hypothetical protein n=1 Tax=Actinacidiphila sp. ITFR-21 TaxID=3075199 RepID=UPI00288B4936|nr:hypothetical protein [Streptomyces sp. ITFR-21]WNI14490.1 hypothetical protein RLT57_02320 [Streptomyces sp. ITFR-21]
MTGVEEPGADGEYRPRVHVAGDFPGGQADLRFGFTLRDGLIAALRIVGAAPRTPAAAACAPDRP